MKILRRDEQKQGHDLMAKIKSEWDLMEEKFRQGEEASIPLCHTFLPFFR